MTTVRRQQPPDEHFVSVISLVATSGVLTTAWHRPRPPYYNLQHQYFMHSAMSGYPSDGAPSSIATKLFFESRFPV
jgi:hypothetical protein